MYVWNKRIVVGLLAAFGLLLALFLSHGAGESVSALKSHTTRWITLNYAGMVIWCFVWMVDQARVRGKNVWLWLFPFLLAPLPTLMAYVLYLQRRVA
jgi:hypothetical protein